MILIFCFKVVVRACYGAYFVAHVLNIWRQILFLGNLHDTTLWNFCIIKCGTFKVPPLPQMRRES